MHLRQMFGSPLLILDFGTCLCSRQRLHIIGHLLVAIGVGRSLVSDIGALDGLCIHYLTQMLSEFASALDLLHPSLEMLSVAQ